MAVTPYPADLPPPVRITWTVTGGRAGTPVARELPSAPYAVPGGVVERAEIEWTLTADERASLERFWRDDLDRVGRFSMQDARDGSTIELAFLGRPMFTARSPALWSARAELVRLA